MLRVHGVALILAGMRPEVIAALFVVPGCVWLLCVVGSGMVAERKGLSVGGYLLAGMLLGPIGLMMALIARPGRDAYPPK